MLQKHVWKHPWQCTSTYIQTQIHTYAHKYIHTHKYTQAICALPKPLHDGHCGFKWFIMQGRLLSSYVAVKTQSSLGGLEPPTFRLTAERANRLRHRDPVFGGIVAPKAKHGVKWPKFCQHPRKICKIWAFWQLFDGIGLGGGSGLATLSNFEKI